MRGGRQKKPAIPPISHIPPKNVKKGTELEGEIQRKFEEVAPVPLCPAFATF